MTAARPLPENRQGVRVTIPVKTVNESNGSHGHWSGKAKRRKAQRELVHLVLPMHVRTAKDMLAGLEGDYLAVTLTRLAPSNGLDDDNLRVALKSVRDQVAAELGVDDRDPRVTWKYEQKRVKRAEPGTKDGYGVEVRINPGEHDVHRT